MTTKRTLAIIIIPRGLALQGEGPDFPHLTSPNGEVHIVGEAFGWELVAQKRAQLADPTQRPPGVRKEDEEQFDKPGQGAAGVYMRGGPRR